MSNMASLEHWTMLERCAPRFWFICPGQWFEIFYEETIFAKMVCKKVPWHRRSLYYFFVFLGWFDYAKKMRSVRAIILPAESRRDLSPRPCSWKNCFFRPWTPRERIRCNLRHIWTPRERIRCPGWAQGRGPAIGQAKWAKRWGRDSFSWWTGKNPNIAEAYLGKYFSDPFDARPWAKELMISKIVGPTAPEKH